MRTFPKPVNPANTTAADIYAAVFAFINAYGLPAMPAAPATGRIFRGYSNRMVLPKDNEYAVMTVIGQRRRGTNVETFDAAAAKEDEDGTATLTELTLCDVQIDFYSPPDTGAEAARLRAQAIELVGRSPWGTKFFQDHGISCLYCDDARDLSAVTDSAQYASRWSVVLHLAYSTSMTAELPYFDEVEVSRIYDANSFSPQGRNKKE